MTGAKTLHPTDEPPSVRVETDADHDAVETIHRAAFGQAEEARIVRALRGSQAFLPELSLVAEHGGQIVGHILFSKLLIRGEKGDTPGLALAPMAVLPERQGRGIGTELVRRGVDEARRLGHEIVVVLGHPDYYPRFGFTPADDRGVRPPFDCPREAFLVLELVPGALQGVEGVVEYAPEFGG
jgi:putative acetyltransferase